mmetsp:Transcript_9585/g.28851  ORF Transcript_9585/g.28851 Transcript_9585/m.28851 type:complete len:373 (-) Transcript_9585:237-1355(-)
MGAVLQGFLALICFLGLLAGGLLATWGVKQLTGSPRSEVFLEAAILYGLGALLFLNDWRRFGPTVALHSSSIAAAVAWLLIVPLGLAGLELVEAIPLAGFAVLAAAVALALYLALGPLGCLLGPAAGALLLYLSTKTDSLVVDELGTAAVFAALHFAVRRALTLRRIEHWPDAEELEPNSYAFRERCDFFEASCYSWAHKYGFRLSVQRIYRMRSAKHRPFWDNPRHLFHGTPWESAHAIVCDGFRLPEHPGMFGKGIYFADCPLKSWQYTRDVGDGLLGCCRRGGLILQCLVDLGEQRQEANANIGLKGYDRNGWWAWLTLQHGAYDSVVGLDHMHGGALRVPEYVVYNPNNVRVEYIFEVTKRPPGPSGQ